VTELPQIRPLSVVLHVKSVRKNCECGPESIHSVGQPLNVDAKFVTSVVTDIERFDRLGGTTYRQSKQRSFSWAIFEA